VCQKTVCSKRDQAKGDQSSRKKLVGEERQRVKVVVKVSNMKYSSKKEKKAAKNRRRKVTQQKNSVHLNPIQEKRRSLKRKTLAEKIGRRVQPSILYLCGKIATEEDDSQWGLTSGTSRGGKNVVQRGAIEGHDLGKEKRRNKKLSAWLSASRGGSMTSKTSPTHSTGTEGQHYSAD